MDLGSVNYLGQKLKGQTPKFVAFLSDYLHSYTVFSMGIKKCHLQSTAVYFQKYVSLRVSDMSLDVQEVSSDIARVSMCCQAAHPPASLYIHQSMAGPLSLEEVQEITGKAAAVYRQLI